MRHLPKEGKRSLQNNTLVSFFFPRERGEGRGLIGVIVFFCSSRHSGLVRGVNPRAPTLVRVGLDEGPLKGVHKCVLRHRCHAVLLVAHNRIKQALHGTGCADVVRLLARVEARAVVLEHRVENVAVHARLVHRHHLGCHIPPAVIRLRAVAVRRLRRRVPRAVHQASKVHHAVEPIVRGVLLRLVLTLVPDVRSVAPGTLQHIRVVPRALKALRFVQRLVRRAAHRRECCRARSGRRIAQRSRIRSRARGDPTRTHLARRHVLVDQRAALVEEVHRAVPVRVVRRVVRDRFTGTQRVCGLRDSGTGSNRRGRQQGRGHSRRRNTSCVQMNASRILLHRLALADLPVAVRRERHVERRPLPPARHRRCCPSGNETFATVR
eukprot:Rhum_TRINITY_DN15390_c0_g1::Rhum_TRINITY_DN15390_c0_g1_i4::g.154169::m.154169